MGFLSGAAPVAATAPDGADQVRAWTAFWREQEPDGRCLAAASPHVTRALESHWHAFAAGLPPEARVLDIGCGSGNVGRLLASVRPYLQVIGVDAAQVPAPGHPRIRVLPGTAVESLPLAAASFDAAVSQFGYEYSNVEVAALELARVLAPRGRFSFLVHHSESPVVRASRTHNRALRELTDGRVMAPFLGGDAASLNRQLRLLEDRHAGEQTIRLAAHGLRSLVGREPRERARLWTAVVEAVQPDRILSDALEASCVAPADLRSWLAPLRARFRLSAPAVVTAAGEPLAWKIEGARLDRA